MSVFPLFSNLWKVWKAADRDARQLQTLQRKPGEHLLQDAGVTRQTVADILRCYRSKQILAFLARFWTR
ncbi:hypothetical protein [Phyllobacterium sp. OV277]|uniref:hypothetical protein n=1 Tax=Phyllobacterium sp. OV277 TaxID=1882772 RepID=UPI00087E61D8|nr:hypothetical protein [Phyllobacterium sp. OV277]SDP02205.1 hypothetical protein SAMN05443582_103181 [Phyllobacterium sp. OV277]